MSAAIEVWPDISDCFDIIENDQLVYVDAPWAGFVRSKRNLELFAFRRLVVIDDLAFHWVFVPAASPDLDVNAVFADAALKPPRHWVSVIEDERGEHRRLSEAWLPGTAYRLPLPGDR